MEIQCIPFRHALHKRAGRSARRNGGGSTHPPPPPAIFLLSFWQESFVKVGISLWNGHTHLSAPPPAISLLHFWQKTSVKKIKSLLWNWHTHLTGPLRQNKIKNSRIFETAIWTDEPRVQISAAWNGQRKSVARCNHDDLAPRFKGLDLRWDCPIFVVTLLPKL